MSMIDDVLFVLVGFSFILIVGGLQAWQHELVHVAAYKDVGVDSSVSLDVLGARVYTQADVNDWVSAGDTDRRFVRLENSFNESVAYNVVPCLLGIMFVLVFGFWWLGIKIDGGRM